MPARYFQRLKRHFKKVLERKTSPKAIGLGFAIGSLISLLPTPGFGVLIGMGLIVIFKRLAKAPLLLGLAIWNPFTMAPVYALSLQIGNWLFGKAPVVEYELSLLQQVFTYSKRFLIGNVICAVTIATLCYFIVWQAAEYRQRKKQRRR